MVESRRGLPHSISKVTMRMPTLLPFGEGRVSGKQSTCAPARSAGVVGTARWKGGSGNRGRPVTGEGSGLNVATGDGHGGGRAGGAGGLRPGNAGGAKGPDFWCAFEDGEVKVIGDEPGNPDNDPDPSEKAVP